MITSPVTGPVTPAAFNIAAAVEPRYHRLRIGNHRHDDAVEVRLAGLPVTRVFRERQRVLLLPFDELEWTGAHCFRGIGCRGGFGDIEELEVVEGEWAWLVGLEDDGVFVGRLD